jgi:hypothetical protein
MQKYLKKNLNTIFKFIHCLKTDFKNYINVIIKYNVLFANIK